MLCCQLDAWSFNKNVRVNGSAVLPALVQLQSIPTVKNSVDCAKNQLCEAMTQRGGCLTLRSLWGHFDTIYLLILSTVSPIEKSAIISELHSYWASNCTLIHPIRCVHVSNLTDHIIAYNYSAWFVLATIIRKWLLLLQLLLLAVAVKVPGW